MSKYHIEKDLNMMKQLPGVVDHKQIKAIYFTSVCHWTIAKQNDGR